MKNKVLIIGADGLIGRTLAEKFVISDKYEVICVDLEFHTLGSLDVRKETIDVCDDDQVKMLFGKYYHLSGIINLAYPKGSGYGSHFFDVNGSDLAKNIGQHVVAYFNVLKYAAMCFKNHNLPHLAILNFSSIYGTIVPKFDIYQNTDMTTPIEYVAMKSSIQAIGKYVSSYVRDTNFRINTICPGGIKDNQSEIFIESYLAKTFGKGLLNPEDLFPLVEFLISDRSKYIVGQDIIIDDGFHLS